MLGTGVFALPNIVMSDESYSLTTLCECAVLAVNEKDKEEVGTKTFRCAVGKRDAAGMKKRCYLHFAVDCCSRSLSV